MAATSSFKKKPKKKATHHEAPPMIPPSTQSGVEVVYVTDEGQGVVLKYVNDLCLTFTKIQDRTRADKKHSTPKPKADPEMSEEYWLS